MKQCEVFLPNHQQKHTDRHTHKNRTIQKPTNSEHNEKTNKLSKEIL